MRSQTVTGSEIIA